MFLYTCIIVGEEFLPVIYLQDQKNDENSENSLCNDPGFVNSFKIIFFHLSLPISLDFLLSL